tara:strand:- start:811 stop:960 length:150 start_codon:yes stop_codon:yes gene_type:complete
MIQLTIFFSFLIQIPVDQFYIHITIEEIIDKIEKNFPVSSKKIFFQSIL